MIKNNIHLEPRRLGSGNSHLRRGAIQLLRTLAGDLRKEYAIYILITFILAASSFLPPHLLFLFTDTAAKINTITVADFAVPFLIFGIAVGVVLFLSSILGNITQEWFQLKVERYLRSKILVRMHNMPMTEVDKAQRGEWLTRMTSDLRSVEEFISTSLPKQLKSVAILLGSGSLFFYHSGTLAILPISACTIIAIISLLVQKNITPLLDDLRSLHSDITQTLLESFEGSKTIRSYQNQKNEIKRFDRKLELIEKKGLKVAKVFGGLLGSNDIVIQVLTTISLTFVMFTLSSGQLTLEAALVYPFYLGMFYSAAETLSASTIDWSSFYVEGGRLAKLLDQNTQTPKATETDHDTSVIQSASGLKLSDVSYGYFEEKPLATNVSLDLKKGETIALVGPSGCGKSTILEVLAGLRPAFSGSWQLDSMDDIPHDFTKQMLPVELSTYVEQRPYIFEGPIRDNLLLGKNDIPDAEIWSALKAANCLSFVTNSGGLDAVLNDAGNNISEGQRYRLALTRALLINSPLLLLDEPFAALDEFSQEVVCRGINKEKSQRMTIIVTHYLPETLEVDRVLQWEDFMDHPQESVVAVVGTADKYILKGENHGTGKKN